MNYFTPDLYIALQDFTSDAAMNAADAAWEDAVERYDAYYRSVQEQLPTGFRKLQENYYLHDAIVEDLARQGNQILIFLRLDTPPHDLLVVRYELAGEPTIDREALPVPYGSTGAAEWMHDEVELISSKPPSCVHSIQLSNGMEIRIPFRDIASPNHHLTFI